MSDLEAIRHCAECNVSQHLSEALKGSLDNNKEFAEAYRKSLAEIEALRDALRECANLSQYTNSEENIPEYVEYVLAGEGEDE